jgi:hypothetical protein
MRRLPVETELSPEDLRTAKRFQYGTTITYCSLVLLLVVVITVKGGGKIPEATVENLQPNIATPTATIVPARAAEVGGAPGGGRAAFSPLCAAKDLALVTAIEAHGDAQDVTSKQLVAAAFAMFEARAACRDGRVADALAIYERSGLGPSALMR